MKKRIRRLRLSGKTKPVDVYAHVDWEKAGTLFRRLKEERERENVARGDVRRDTTKRILAALAAAGTIGLIFTFPTAVPVLGVIAKAVQSMNWRERKTIRRLTQQKWVKVQENADGTVTVQITKTGMTRALTYALDDMAIAKPKRWDKKWRIVIFDIPEQYKRLRDIFRMRLGQLGLTMLQESVFVSPYPCFDEVEFLRELYGVTISVRYLLVERIEDDVELREKYDL